MEKALTAATAEYLNLSKNKFIVSEVEEDTKSFTITYGNGDWDAAQYELNTNGEIIDVYIIHGNEQMLLEEHYN